MVIPYIKCMLVVASTVGLPPRVLPVLQAMEGGKVGMVREDANGTADLGVMQVNTIWIPVLAARAGLTELETRRRMIEEPCFNIAAAALVMRNYLAETGGALLPAIGDYHSHSKDLNAAYQAQALRTARNLFTTAASAQR
ncbi:MAG TPA: lytic transglycosylase domain-containing protein [Acidisoma sp.]|uniref:lytic transglycosylase domain-containing protein n=1 Tax=Acidisoma sp. TaxID=1872115 RepID=UPI002C946B5A|nr:lytic transglycosylase domain-containing protein [Acidisoma sp.]HTH99932.1 lytic transglycosylase domain-containing protein [Acidisoma sp.]